MSRSLFRSSDHAETWQPIANPVTGTPSFIAPDPRQARTIYLCQTGVTPKGSGIWKSTDDGDTWKQICQSTRFGKNSSGVVDPGNATILYWTAADKGVLPSSNAGASWQDWSDGLPREKLKYTYSFAHKLKLDHNTPPAQRRIYYPTNLGLYEAMAADGAWKLAPGPPAETCSDINVSDHGIMYAAFPGVGLFVSRDEGATWQRRTKGLERATPGRVAATRDRPDIVYVASGGNMGNAIYGSRDYGETFKLLTDARFHAGMNWPIDYRQEEGVMARELFVDPHDPMTVYVVRGMKSTDGGSTWQKYGMKEIGQDRWQGTLPLLTQYRVAFDPHRENIVWLGYSDTGLMLTEDGGKTVVAATNFHRGEVNQTAYWRDKLVRSSGSCVSIAVDPDRPTTIYASISGKIMESRSGGGIVIKTVDSGWNWTPIYEKNGLADGIVRSIVIDPSSPVEDRTLYVASVGNGVYKSADDGKSFHNTTSADLFHGNTRIMSVALAKSDPRTLYLGVGGSQGIRPIYFAGEGGYPALKPGIFGGVFRTADGGMSWQKCNRSRELPSVQEVAVDPTNAKVVYAAVYSEDYRFKDQKVDADWGKGGIYKSADGGGAWERVFVSPIDEWKGKGEVQAICINPIAPEIVYAVVENYGVYGSYDAGKTWSPVGQASMDRLQRRFHSINLNPHDRSEIWISHFGTGFSKGVDAHARAIMDERFRHANFIVDPSFEMTAESGFGKYWKVEQPPAPPNEKPVVSVSDHARDGRSAVRFHLTAGYSNAPSTIPGQMEQRRLEMAGLLPADNIRKVRRRNRDLDVPENRSLLHPIDEGPEDRH